MAKMLARRVCGDCGRGYNLANIKEGEGVSAAAATTERRAAHQSVTARPAVRRSDCRCGGRL
jgi:hypothetical protein